MEFTCAKVPLLFIIMMLMIKAAAPDGGACSDALCGEGKCEEAGDQQGSIIASPFGYICKCNPGWLQLSGDDQFLFLPCVIPDCNISSSCSSNNNSKSSGYSSVLSPPPLPSFNLSSFLDPCTWAYCGGGKCERSSESSGQLFSRHRCVCDNGFSNLMNSSTFPCFQNCSIGVDCKSLGITTPSNSSSSSPSSRLPDTSAGSSPVSTARSSTNLQQTLLLLMTAMPLLTQLTVHFI